MASHELVKKALLQATPAQLIRVRGALSSFIATGGYIDWTRKKEKAIQDFDAGLFDNPDIARFLSDKELGEALR